MANFNWKSVDWGSIANAGASWYASKKAGDAAKQAGNVQAAGDEASAQLSRDVFDYQKQLNQPFYNSQIAALNEYNALMGLPGVQMPTSMTGGAVASGATPQAASGMPTQWLGYGKTPSVNQELYNTDPRYRMAWDRATGEHQKQFGRGYNKHSDRNTIIARLQQLYGPAQKAAQPGQISILPAKATKTPQQLQQEAFAKFRNQPGYQFGLTEGQRTIDASAAASGGLFSGKAGKALMKFGRDYSDQQGFTPYMNRVAAAAGIGQTNPVGNLQMAGGQYAQDAGSAMHNAARARGSGLLGAADARYQGWSDAAGFLGKAYGNMGWGS